jgi:hypothetical protein
MQARKWRTMAAAAAEKKTGSARFVWAGKVLCIKAILSDSLSFSS